MYYIKRIDYINSRIGQKMCHRFELTSYLRLSGDLRLVICDSDTNEDRVFDTRRLGYEELYQTLKILNPYGVIFCDRPSESEIIFLADSLAWSLIGVVDKVESVSIDCSYAGHKRNPIYKLLDKTAAFDSIDAFSTLFTGDIAKHCSVVYDTRSRVECTLLDLMIFYKDNWIKDCFYFGRVDYIEPYKMGGYKVSFIDVAAARRIIAKTAVFNYNPLMDVVNLMN